MTTRTHCLITGCALQLLHSEHRAWGDLHIQGDRFIFNAVTDPDDGGTRWFSPDVEEDAWAFNPTSHPSSRCVLLTPSDEYFERRGVWVFRASRSLFNVHALAYVNQYWTELPA